MLLCSMAVNLPEVKVNSRLFYIFQSKTGQITLVVNIGKNDILGS